MKNSFNKSIGLVKLAIKELSLLENKEKLDLSDKTIGCYIKINGKVFDILLYNIKEPTVCNLIVKKGDSIEISFKNMKKNGEEYGKSFIDIDSINLKGNKTVWYILYKGNSLFS